MAWVFKSTGEVPTNYPDCGWDEVLLIDEHDIWNEGNDACAAGKGLDTNPWPVDSYAYDVWSDGWNDWDMNELGNMPEDE